MVPFSTADPAYERFLSWRGVLTPCSRCCGRGCYAYSHGSTWRGGMGTNSFQWDVCDACWGTGDADRTGVDLRKQREEFNSAVAAEAAQYLRLTTGASARLRAPVEELAQELERLARGRKPRSMYFNAMALYLARKIREMAKTEVTV